MNVISGHKVLAAVIGVLVLLALCAGTAMAVTNATNSHNAAVQRAAATAAHNRAVASARAQARTDALNRAIAAANRKAEKAARDARRARRAANKSAPAPVVVAPAQGAAPAAPAYDSPPEDVIVVEQYLGDISSGDYADAWALGGGNIAGTDYNTWVAGYATTTSVTANNVTDNGDGSAQASFTATQSDGGSTSYAGTYYVSGGVITSASITQTG